MKKKAFASLPLMLLAALLIVGGTVAWFTASAHKANELTAGTVEIEIQENYTKPDTWSPGNTATKQVTVKSLGSKQTYVRALLTPVWSDPSLPIDNVQLNLASNSDWVLHTDGWYYYKSILNKNEATTALLASVKLLDDDNGYDYTDAVLEIVVDAEAVQASHEAYKDVWGLQALPTGVQAWVSQ